MTRKMWVHQNGNRYPQIKESQFNTQYGIITQWLQIIYWFQLENPIYWISWFGWLKTLCESD